jgi:hypothetical protein
MVFVTGNPVSLVTYTSDTADDGTVTPATACFGDASCAISCQEVKINEKGIKFIKDSDASNMSAVTIRICVQSIMTAGDNDLLAYTDANSVTASNSVSLGSNLSVGDNDFTITQAFLDEIWLGVSHNFELRVTSGSGGSKNKIGEMSIQYTIPLIDITGVTKDDDDNIVDEMPLTLLRRSGGSAPYTWTTLDTLTSDVTTGAYTFSYEDDSSQYRVFGQNTDGTQSDITPEVQGV